MNMISAVRTLALGLAFVLAPGVSVAAKVFVANEGSSSLTVVDAESYKLLATVPVGRAPHNVQVSPDGKLAWLTAEGEPRAIWAVNT